MYVTKIHNYLKNDYIQKIERLIIKFLDHEGQK